MRVRGKKGLRPLIWIVAATVLTAVLFGIAVAHWHSRNGARPVFGVTFSPLYAEQLGVDWREAYLAALDDLEIRAFRIPVYWSEVEPVPGEYHWEDVDWMMSEAATRGARVTLAIGRKLPRWPECFIPDWAEQLDTPTAETAQLKMMELAVLRYKDSPALDRWQVENEAAFPFGVCPPPDLKLLEREVELVRSLDSHPVQLTVSGEIDPWVDAAALADVLGVSLYRTTWNPLYGFFIYPITPGYYRTRAASVSPFAEVVISELQAEPWLNEPLSEMTREERANGFTARDLSHNVDFAVRTQLPEAYLWGVEWWYAELQAGNATLWEEAKQIW